MWRRTFDLALLALWHRAMDAAVWGVIGVLIGGLITGYVTIRAEQLRTERENKLDSTRRADDREIERDRFQLSTLQDVQIALPDGR